MLTTTLVTYQPVERLKVLSLNASIHTCILIQNILFILSVVSVVQLKHCTTSILQNRKILIKYVGRRTS